MGLQKMEILLISLAAFLASGFTFFSGFGLGTLLLPAMALFFPVPTAVALTAVVHFLNNLFKLGLVGRGAHRGVVLRFGLPALAAAPLGAWALLGLTRIPPLASYSFFGRELSITPVNSVVALLMVGFALAELAPQLQKLSLPARYLPLGGLASGFFGGLSGHQGAFRSTFLTHVGLSKEGFIGTGVVIALLVDVGRITVYAGSPILVGWGRELPLLAAATGSAFAGAWLGARLLPKVTFGWIRRLVAILLIAIALGLATGVLAT